jgi:hypothetical protein
MLAAVRLGGCDPPPHAVGMFVVTEEEAAAIRAAFDQGGELAGAVELRRLFPGITDNEQARACARTIAGWKPEAAATAADTGTAVGAGLTDPPGASPRDPPRRYPRDSPAIHV